MTKKVWLVGLVGVLVFSLTGCFTTRKNKDLEMQGLRNQASALEAQGTTKEEVVSEQAAKSNELTAAASGKVTETKQHPTAKQIQTALKNAGYYQGAIDGKIGKMSHEAIKAFQKANNLTEDGRVGKKTWAVLKDYLDKKTK